MNARGFLCAIGIAVMAVGCGPGSGGHGAADAAGPGMLAGAPATSFPMKRTDGAQDELANYRGKVVLVNLWATWCPPCIAEMPALEQLHRQLGLKGLVVLGVDQGESANAARAFASRRGVTFPILLDEQQQYGRAFAAVGLPTSVIVDRSGHIVRGIDGALTLAQMRDAVLPVLRAQ